jgi:hypothetical protein
MTEITVEPLRDRFAPRRPELPGLVAGRPGGRR